MNICTYSSLQHHSLFNKSIGAVLFGDPCSLAAILIIAHLPKRVKGLYLIFHGLKI